MDRIKINELPQEVVKSMTKIGNIATQALLGRVEEDKTHKDVLLIRPLVEKEEITLTVPRQKR